jgi:hypothetical protein
MGESLLEILLQEKMFQKKRKKKRKMTTRSSSSESFLEVNNDAQGVKPISIASH